MRDRVDALLKENDAELVRNHKHQVWRLPNGRIFVRSNTPGDRHEGRNSLSDLRRVLGIQIKPKEGVRRERKLGGGRDRTIKYDRSVNTSLADQLRVSGVTEQSLRDDIEMLLYQNEMLSAAIDVTEMDMPAEPCWLCRIHDWWRERKNG